MPAHTQTLRPSSAKAALAAFGILLAGAAWADGEPSMFTLSGYGTLGAVYYDRPGVQYRRDMSQHIGTQSKEVSFLPDTMLAVQLTARPSDRLEAAVQMVSRNAVEHNYRPETNWAYVRSKPIEELALRAGRLGGDMFLQGDSSEIGFANLSIRQPLYFYPHIYDGVDAEVTQPLGPGLMRVKAMAGHLVGKLITTNQPVYNIDGSRVVGGMAEYSQAGWTARLSTGRIVYKHEFEEAGRQALVAALAYVPNRADILATATMENRSLHYYSADLSYDSGALRGCVSFVQTVSDHWQDQNQFNLKLGYRLGKFTPYAGYHKNWTNRSTLPTGIPWGLSPATDMLNVAMEGVQGAFKRNDSDTLVGVRYDATRNTAFKVQADLFRYQDSFEIYDPQQFATRFADRKWRTLPMLSAALEFVF